MYLMAPSVFHDYSKFGVFREMGGQTYAQHIVITMGEFLSELCKKEVLDCLNIPEVRIDNRLDIECLRVLEKYSICFTHDMLRGCDKIN